MGDAKETLDAMRLGTAVELRVNPLLARKGEQPTAVFEKDWIVLLFYSEAERVVWLDSMRERGMQG